jgi:hypothetical protein
MVPCDGVRIASWSDCSDDRSRGQAVTPPPLGRIGRVEWACTSTGQAVRRDTVRGRSALAMACHRPRRAPFAIVLGAPGSPHVGPWAVDLNLPRLRIEGAASTPGFDAPGIDERTRIRPIEHGSGPDGLRQSIGSARKRHRPPHHPIHPPAHARPLRAGAARRAGAPEFTPR